MIDLSSPIPAASLLAALSTGLFGGLAGSLFNNWATGRRERLRTLEDGRFRIYMMLLDLHGHHFWVSAAAARGEEPKPEQTERFGMTAMKIADELRRYRLPEAEAILEVPFGVRFANEFERARALDGVIDRIADKAIPHFIRALRRVTSENDKLMASDFDEYWRRWNFRDPSWLPPLCGHHR